MSAAFLLSIALVTIAFGSEYAGILRPHASATRLLHGTARPHKRPAAALFPARLREVMVASAGRRGLGLGAIMPARVKNPPVAYDRQAPLRCH